uniref:Ig-like domain-containing protein n=1 Tax=Mus spicilegus TaxID=10103 RepID=A0A8C6GRR4_MUSSI
MGCTARSKGNLYISFRVCSLHLPVSLQPLIATPVSTEEFLVFGPSDPIVAAPGGEAILPCSVFPAMNVENMEELRWFRSRFSEAVLVYRDQEEQKREQLPEYSQRTSLVKDKFHQGTAAVRILNVQAPDSGIYICHFKQGVFYEEAILELKVAGWLTDPLY